MHHLEKMLLCYDAFSNMATSRVHIGLHSALLPSTSAGKLSAWPETCWWWRAVLRVCLGWFFFSFANLVPLHSLPAPGTPVLMRLCGNEQTLLCSWLCVSMLSAFLPFPSVEGFSCLGSSPRTMAPAAPALPSLSKMRFEASAVVIWVCIAGGANTTIPKGGTLALHPVMKFSLKAGLKMGSRSCHAACSMAVVTGWQNSKVAVASDRDLSLAFLLVAVVAIIVCLQLSPGYAAMPSSCSSCIPASRSSPIAGGGHLEHLLGLR